MRGKTIVVLNRSGQLCNQLLTLASFYSLGLAWNKNIICATIDPELKKYFTFDRTDNSDITVKMYYSPFLEFLRDKMATTTRLYGWPKEGAHFVEKKYSFFTGYFLHAFALYDAGTVMAQYHQEIRSMFAFQPAIAEKSAQIIATAKKDDAEKALVAVHLRRGDYKTYKNGVFYYEDAQYLKWMQALAQDKNVSFVLFSNEPIDLAYYREYGLQVEAPKGTTIEDLCTMSMCDYIMGPPSTYSAWAAMYGDKKCCHIEDGSKAYTWADFQSFTCLQVLH